MLQIMSSRPQHSIPTWELGTIYAFSTSPCKTQKERD